MISAGVATPLWGRYYTKEPCSWVNSVIEVASHLLREKPGYSILGKDHEYHLVDQAGMDGPRRTPTLQLCS